MKSSLKVNYIALTVSASGYLPGRPAPPQPGTASGYAADG